MKAEAVYKMTKLNIPNSLGTILIDYFDGLIKENKELTIKLNNYGSNR